ncbi:MAG: hypothetical protein AMXMBFR53_36040 [Gemmatimonadota bacterium]
MARSSPLFCFDYLDPLSYLVQRELDALAAEGALPSVRRIPLEIRTPAQPMLDPDDAPWRTLWARAEEEAAALGVPLVPPTLLPWTRKAHELVLHAGEKGVGDEAHRLVFEALFRRGRDIGRVDVLVELARELGMDAQEAKAVLDVDRFAADVAALGAEARAAGAGSPPTLVLGARTLRGFHNRDALRTFLVR